LSEILFSICHTTARPGGWQESYRAWIDNADRPDQVEYLLCVDERWGFPALPHSEFFSSRFSPTATREQFGYVGSPKISADVLDVAVWNTGRKCLVDGANIACANAFGQILIVNSDDMFPCAGWDTKILEAAGKTGTSPAPWTAGLDSEFVIRTHPGKKYQAWLDEFVRQGRGEIIGRLMTLQILSRARYRRFGYALYPEFTSMMADTDFTDAAEHDGVVIEARHITIEHRHPFVTGESQDSVSKHENDRAAHELGSRIFARRHMERTGSAAEVQQPKRMKLAALLPGDVFSWTWTDAWSRLLLHLGGRFDFAFTFESCSNQYFARDFAYQALLRHNKAQDWTPDYALWIDSDNILTPEQFDLLFDAIETVPMISAIAGWYWIDVDPPQVCARVRDEKGQVRSVTIDELMN